MPNLKTIVNSTGNLVERSFVAKLAVLITIIATGIVLVQSGSGAGLVIGTLLIGVMFAHALELQHQCLHHQGFALKPLNRIVGFILGVPMLVSFSHYRARHLHHHRHLGRKTDTEFFNYNTNGSLSLKTFAWDFLGISQLMSAAKSILVAIGVAENSDEHFSSNARLEYIGIAALAILSLSLAPSFFLFVWILPLLLVAGPTHFLIEIPEHLFCDRNSLDVFRNTRSIQGSWFSLWLTNGNNLHVEHHRKPSLPFIDLVSEYQATPTQAYQFHEETYFKFYSQVYQTLVRNVDQTAAAEALR